MAAMIVLAGLALIGLAAAALLPSIPKPGDPVEVADVGALEVAG